MAHLTIGYKPYKKYKYLVAVKLNKKNVIFEFPTKKKQEQFINNLPHNISWLKSKKVIYERKRK